MKIEESNATTRQAALDEAMRDAKWGIAFTEWWADVTKYQGKKN